MNSYQKDKVKIQEVAKSLPSDKSELLALAAGAVDTMHESILCCDQESAFAAGTVYEAVVFKLNGGTFSGCMDSSNPNAGGNMVIEHCRAKKGEIPKWGQYGEFLLTVQGVRVRVVIGDGFGLFRIGFNFHVVDCNLPFISETGYRSHYDTAMGNRTVDELASMIIAEYLKNGRTLLNPNYRERCANQFQPIWLIDQLGTETKKSEYQDQDGQMAFGF
ncbi:hypothetical protein EV681_4610 [Advenella incenata]|uniref:Uncharacterized protein n=1 Tax=Advenella incenata TaxID=267800 RepID=A0A4Q7V8P4_9BURK|nr:hypothetical protein [Advenella incenata]RZT91022.1 hypothetical protein EV681_4610 [Advenella incenata]